MFYVSTESQASILTMSVVADAGPENAPVVAAPPSDVTNENGKSSVTSTAALPLNVLP